MRRGADNLGNVLVLGLGKSGRAAARYCAGLLGTRVDGVFVVDGTCTDETMAFLESIEQPGVGYAFGNDALAGPGTGFDLCIASPGIPYWHDLYVAGEKLSRELISEIEFAWRESEADSTWVAITGTNGKTTTTSLAAHVLGECGFAARAVGNIGDVCLEAVAEGQTDVYVAEVSSYQLYSTRDFAPDVSVLLNITPDHLHWHKTLEAYRDAKFNILRVKKTGLDGGAPSQIAILDATNDVVRAKVRELKSTGADYIPLGTAEGIGGDMRARCGAESAAFIDGAGQLTVAWRGVEHDIANVSDLRIRGEHNASNALAAAAVAVALGADDASIARSLASFAPLEHRIEPCGSIAGIECFNDSKATNVDATVKALDAFPGKRVAVLLGGDDKGTDLADLVTAVFENARCAICFGAAGPRILSALEAASGQAPDGFACVSALHMEEALDAALARADSIDVVLLSPACASFDEFRSFEHRGEVFKRLVAERAAQIGGRA